MTDKNMNIDLSKYILVKADSIEPVESTEELFDITVEENRTFIIDCDDIRILAKNCDGEHITSLLVNLFYRWFPYVIRQKKLGLLIKPLMSYELEGKKGRNYVYSISQYKKIIASGKKARNVRYLKGLGSNDIQDWEWIFKNIDIQLFREDSQALRYLDIAFGPSAQKRKDWLQTTPSYE
jgi:DNA gyrase/topoisomerase IV subunit B